MLRGTLRGLLRRVRRSAGRTLNEEPDDPRGRYAIVIWCHDCRQGRHPPQTCTTAGLEQRYAPFRDADHARTWANKAAISKRVPLMFELEDLKTGERARLTGFRATDYPD